MQSGVVWTGSLGASIILSYLSVVTSGLLEYMTLSSEVFHCITISPVSSKCFLIQACV